jgi:hypothetical protein
MESTIPRKPVRLFGVSRKHVLVIVELAHAPKYMVNFFKSDFGAAKMQFGQALSISELPQDSAKDLVNQESIRNDKDLCSERVLIDPVGATQYTGLRTTKAVQRDEAKIITNLTKSENLKSRPCGHKVQGIFVHHKDKCHVMGSREPTGRRHGQDGFEILEKGWHERGNKGSRIPKGELSARNASQNNTRHARHRLMGMVETKSSP